MVLSLLMLVLLIVSFVYRVETAWNAMQGTDTSVDYFGVKYVLDGEADALSANAVAVGASGSTGRIVSSSDGGQTWSTSFSTSLVLTDIAVAYQGGVTHYLVGGINTAASSESSPLGISISFKDDFNNNIQLLL